MDFHTTTKGIFCDAKDGSTKVTDQPVEVVSVSALDHVLYLRWPAQHRYHHLVAMPQGLVDNPEPEKLRDWAEHQGLELDYGQELAFADYLRQQVATQN